MDSLSLRRGAFRIELDRPRVCFFDMTATGLLYERFGPEFPSSLYTVQKADDKLDIRMTSVENLAYFLYAGLLREARETGEELTLEQVQDFIFPGNVRRIFGAVFDAFFRTHATPTEPELAKKKQEVPLGRVKGPKGPGPTLASTSMKRSGSR